MVIYLWNSLRLSFPSVKRIKAYCKILATVKSLSIDIISVKNEHVHQTVVSVTSFLPATVTEASKPSLLPKLSHIAAKMLVKHLAIIQVK